MTHTVEELRRDRETLLMGAELQAAHDKLAAADLLVEWLGPKGFLGEMAASVAGEVEKRVRELTGDPAFTFLLYDGQERPTFDFGLRDKDGTFRSWRTLSAGEVSAMLAAVTAAVLERSKAEFKILAVDNLERLGGDASEFVGRLGLLVEWGVLDQVIAAGSSELDPTEWKHLETAPLVVDVA